MMQQIKQHLAGGWPAADDFYDGLHYAYRVSAHYAETGECIYIDGLSPIALMLSEPESLIC